ncbi:hypothetical protein [Nannocystis pusilla]|nr:hypothetical protein [Nannocystis pusilla]
MKAFPSPTDHAPRHALATDLTLGGAVGTLFGLLVGLSGSTAVLAIAAVATALAGSVVVLRGSEAAIRPARAGAIAVTAIASLVLGTWLQRHDAFGPTPAEDVAAWQAAGLSKREAQVVAAGMWTGAPLQAVPAAAKPAVDPSKLTPAKRMAKRTAEQYCADLDRRKYTPTEELRSWKLRGDSWAQAAKFVETLPCSLRVKTMNELRALACGRH